jgi:hypothetical protein
MLSLNSMRGQSGEDIGQRQGEESEGEGDLN